MKSETYDAVKAALKSLTEQQASDANEAIPAIKVANEAGISKASLYRCFQAHPELQASFSDLRARKSKLSKSVETGAFQDKSTGKEQPVSLVAKVAALQQELITLRREADQDRKLSSQKVQLLWLENNRLRALISELRSPPDTSPIVVRIDQVRG